MTMPSIWANLMTSACWARDREDDDLLLAVEGRAGLPASDAPMPAAAAALGRGGATGGSSVPRTCMPWRRSLTLVPLRPVDDGDRRCPTGLTVMTGNLSRGQADDHVDVVAGLDDGADAADLVDLDGDGSACPAGVRR